MIFKTVVVGPMAVNCYILASAKDSPAMIIDPGDDAAKIWKALDSFRLKPALIINTHAHYDHIGSDDKFGVGVYVHSQDVKALKDTSLNFSHLLGASYQVKAQIQALRDGQILESGAIALEVIHTPGHTAGGISLLMKKPKNDILFTGDTLFCQGIGRADLGGDEELLIRSIKERLLVLPDHTTVYPGHGPATTIGSEKKNNPFLY